MRSGNSSAIVRRREAEGKRDEMKGISYEIKELDEKIKRCEDAIAEILLLIPNLPDASVPVGPDETGNVEVKKNGVSRLNSPLSQRRTGISARPLI